MEDFLYKIFEEFFNSKLLPVFVPLIDILLREVSFKGLKF